VPLTPAPAEAAPAPAPAVEASAAPDPAPAPAPAAGLNPKPTLSPKPGLAPKPALKLQGNTDGKFERTESFASPMPKIEVVNESVSPVFTVLSGLAAAAAITFAVLLYLKNQ
jgi:hypothetical protein